MSVGQALWVQNESYKGDQNKKLMAVGGNSGRFWYDVSPQTIIPFSPHTARPRSPPSASA